MKKLLVLFLVMTVAFCSFAACGGTNDKDGDVNSGGGSGSSTETVVQPITNGGVHEFN